MYAKSITNIQTETSQSDPRWVTEYSANLCRRVMTDNTGRQKRSYIVAGPSLLRHNFPGSPNCQNLIWTLRNVECWWKVHRRGKLSSLKWIQWGRVKIWRWNSSAFSWIKSSLTPSHWLILLSILNQIQNGTILAQIWINSWLQQWSVIINAAPNQKFSWSTLTYCL